MLECILALRTQCFQDSDDEEEDDDDYIGVMLCKILRDTYSLKSTKYPSLRMLN